MAVPVIAAVVAIVSAVGGIGAGSVGAYRIANASSLLKGEQAEYDELYKLTEVQSKRTLLMTDELGNLELNILYSFGKFQKLFAKIHDKPEFAEIMREDISLPGFDTLELENIAVGASILLSGVSSLGLGAASGFAASGVTTSAVMALGVASTGTKITTLSGAAATKAVLAALGGGSVASGGGGIAVGTAVLGGLATGVAILVGGIAVAASSGKIKNQVNAITQEIKDAEYELVKIMAHLYELEKVSSEYCKVLESLYGIYQQYLKKLEQLVDVYQKRDWNKFSEKEKKLTENLILLVSLLYQLCKTPLVMRSQLIAENGEYDMSTINRQELKNNVDMANSYLKQNIERS